MASLNKKRAGDDLSSGCTKKSATMKSKKKVKFSQDEPKLYLFDPNNGHAAPIKTSNIGNKVEGGAERTSQLTEELTLLSTLHGKSRRELRDISKHDLKTVMKYGTKTKGNCVNGDQRWKFEFGNTTYITDNSCRKEITCYKKAIQIEPATITQKMIDNHKEAERILREDPHLCTTHSIIIIDQSGSMRTCDVNGFRSRSDAAYGTLALDYIAEQLYQQGGGDELFIDAVTIIEMNDTGSLFLHKEPLDWILFNKVLERLSTAKPKSHGNYVEALEFAEDIIKGELSSFKDLDADDIPAFMLLFLSDGKPSDKLPDHQTRRLQSITRLAQKLKSKLTFYGMGIGSSGSDFEQLQLLVNTAEVYGSEGQFNHAGLNPASLSTYFSSIATSMTTTRNDLRSTKDDGKKTKTEKSYTMRQKKTEVNAMVPFRRETTAVSRWLHDSSLTYPWRQVDFFNDECTGLEIEKDPFGKGAERLAYMFHEIKPKSTGPGWEQLGKAMVAKESRYIEDEQSKEAFHTNFCRVQNKAKEFSKLFNDAVQKAPLLQPSKDEVSLPPPIDFLKCSVYEYKNSYGDRCGLLVERYLNGKFTKFNSNNGYVNSDIRGEESIDLAIGEVKLTDFVHAFSHWVYVQTNHNVLVCDLQGVLDMEGRRPIFRLTDPAICSKRRSSHRYGKTDLGVKGIRCFCFTHKCNDVCKGLSLPIMRNGRR